MSISIIQSILFFISLKIILIYFYSKLASRIGLVDIPNERKNHIGNIPLVGGVCIYSCLILYFIFFDTSLNHKIIFLSSMVIFILGLYDDLYNLGVAERIFFQTLICLVIVGFGIRIFDLGTFTIGSNTDLLINLGGFGIILTVLCIIGYSNAINFSDGLDGLAGGYLLNVFLSIILFSYYFEQNDNLEIIFLIVILLIVFLISNFGFILPKIFLGDNGSTSIGFLASCYLIYFTLPENRHFHPVLTLWAAPMPIFDFITIFFYRIINKRSPFYPDRNHLHYLLISKSLSPNLATLLLVLSSFILSLIGFFTLIYFGSLSTFILFFLFMLVYFLIFIFFKTN